MYQITYGCLILAVGETKADCIEQLAYTALPTIITISHHEDYQLVTVSNTIWVNKHVELPTSYTTQFSRSEILNDIAEKVCRMNNYTLQRITE